MVHFINIPFPSVVLYLLREALLLKVRSTEEVRERETNTNKKIRVGINGFGRIGRLAFRLAFESDDSRLEFVHVNEGIGSGESSAYLANWDSARTVARMQHGVRREDGDDDGGERK